MENVDKEEETTNKTEIQNKKEETTNKTEIQNKKEENSDDEKVENLLQDNIIRRTANFLNRTFDFKKLRHTNLYMDIHTILIFIIGFVGLFNSSAFYLCILLIVVTLDAFSVVVLHECPLTTLERKYINQTSCDIRNNILKSANIVYNCDHDYEKQVELLINVWTLIAGKCVCILFLRTFNIQLFNYNNLYAN